MGKCTVCTRLDDVASTRFGVKVVYSYVRTRQYSSIVSRSQEKLGLRLLNALTSFGGHIAGKR